MRPSSYEQGFYPWVLADLPKDHPARFCATFLVHGMGEPKFTQTAANLRSGFEDNMGDAIITDPPKFPPPYISEGYWGNYDDLARTFPEVWEKFGRGEQTFFAGLWRTRSHGLMATVLWFMRQLWSLVGPRAVREMGWKTQLIYWPLQILFPAALVVLFFKMPRAITHVLNDVRVYCAPDGMIEDVIVQGIDRRVARSFLKMLGLNENFRALDDARALHANAEPVRFNRVVWVAHSLGTVVSYNALSDLFREAARLETAGDADQKAGVVKFRSSLVAFITLGSPLNKISHLCGRDAIKPWPAPRDMLLAGKNHGRNDWWLNYFDILDPVSGSLDHPLLFQTNPANEAYSFIQPGPQNFCVDMKAEGFVPGLAHIAYWKDKTVTGVVVNLTYGPAYPGRLESFGKTISFGQRMLWYFAWLGIVLAMLAGLALVILWAACHWVPWLLPVWLLHFCQSLHLLATPPAA
jgi:hypothetical protein